jgi:LTXXQ motif family protein
MRGRIIVLLALTGAALTLPDAAQAQLSPRGILGGITAPFREMLGHGRRHYPHRRQQETNTQQPAKTNEDTAQVAANCPQAWPNAYDQALGFTFWPDDYAPQFRGRGFDVIANTISGRSDMPRREARVATTGSAVHSDTAGNENTTNWPGDRIRAALQLTDAQSEALKKLQEAVAKSDDAIKHSCSGTRGSSPERLSVLISSIWAVRDAGNSVRAPLKDFYEMLTPAQKQGFASRQPQPNAAAPNNQPANDQPGQNNPNANAAMQACARPNIEESERLVREIKMRVRPNRQQTASLENFHQAAGDMAKMMIASCAQPAPAEPLARLNAVEDQLTVLNYAASTVQIAFNDFYGRLDNGQKARLDAMAR